MSGETITSAPAITPWGKGAPWLIWGTASAFVLFQFFLQLSSGVIVTDMMHSFALNAFSASLLISSYYYIYFILQTPAGLLIDRYGSRLILTLGSLFCGIGCLLFALTHNFATAEWARLAMGTGAAFAFVGEMHLIREWFPSHRFSMMVGYAETLGMIGTIVGSILLAKLVQTAGWRDCMLGAGFIAIAISLASWIFIKDNPLNHAMRREQSGHIQFRERLMGVISKPAAWVNGAYLGLMFAPITVFSALWGIPFLKNTLHTSLTVTTSIDSLLIAGAGIGSPIYGALYTYTIKRYRPLMFIGAVLSFILMSIILFAPPHSVWLMGLLLFLLGMTCSSYMLSFGVANHIAPPYAKNTSIGFVNAWCVVTAPILQPVVGMIMDKMARSHGHITHVGHAVTTSFTRGDYQIGLSVLPLACLMSAVLALWVNE
jgi:MFS family permease